MKKWGIAWPKSTVAIKRIKKEQIAWTVVARLKCYLCGGFKRKLPCPPFNKSVKFYKDKFEKAKKIYVIVEETDGTVPWRKGIPKEKLEKKVNKGLKGVAKEMPLELHKKMLKLKRRKKCQIFISGSCSLCRPCNIEGKKCLKGGFAHSPEGSGVDVINTIRNIGLKIDDVPYNSVVNVGMALFT